MSKETSTQSEKSGRTNKAANKQSKEGFAKVEAVLPEGSWQRVAAGVTAAAGGGLIAAAMVGVGPAALAGAAGYLAYRGLKKQNADLEIQKH